MAKEQSDAVGEMVKAMLAERLDRELAGRVDAWQGLFESIDTSLASLVEAAEKAGSKSLASELSSAMARAFAQIKMPAPAAPQQLPAPQVTVKPEFTVPPAPPPTVVMPSQDAVFDIEFKYGNGGRLTGMTVSRKAG